MVRGTGRTNLEPAAYPIRIRYIMEYLYDQENHGLAAKCSEFNPAVSVRPRIQRHAGGVPAAVPNRLSLVTTQSWFGQSPWVKALPEVWARAYREWDRGHASSVGAEGS